MLKEIKIKNYLPYFGALLGVFLIIYALITTPGPSDTSSRFSIMQDDLRRLVGDESVVKSRHTVNKYGMASLDVDVVGLSIGDDDVQGLGWIPLPGGKHAFCKDGIIYVMSSSKQTYMGMKILRINFRYTSKTIETCRKVE